MNGIEHDSGVVNIDKFNQHETRRMTGQLLFFEGKLDVLPVRLCSRDRVISVRHRKDGIPLAVQCLNDCLREIFRHKPARQMSAALHEVEIIHLLQFLAQEHLDRFILFIPIKQDGMRKLKGRFFTLCNAGRQPRGDHFLR